MKLTTDYIIDCDVSGCGNSTPPQPGIFGAYKWAKENGWTMVNGHDYCPNHGNQSLPDSRRTIFNPANGEMIEWNVKQPELVRVR
jgi:hypothetical protein